MEEAGASDRSFCAAAIPAAPPATQAGEPRQARKGATVSRTLRVIGIPWPEPAARVRPEAPSPTGAPHGPLTFSPFWLS